MPSSATLTFKGVVNAPAAEAFRAFTHPTALRDWLCNAAQADARPGGRLYLWWEDGYSAHGAYTQYEPSQRLAFTWDGRQEPGPMQVRVTFKEKDGCTQVAVAHGGVGSGPKWTATRQGLEAQWPEALAGLASLLETGVDLRQARRPRLGIGIDDFNAEIGARLGVPSKFGIRLSGTAEGTGARAAGLQKDDVLISLNGQKLVAFDSFGPALKGLKAGDWPKVAFYRGGQKHTVALQLSQFPVAEVPGTGAALAEAVRPLHAEVDAGLAELVAGLTEAQAARRPAENEWSAKELIGHFILTERDLQGWIADMLNDTPVEDSLLFRPNATVRIEALVKRLGTVDALRAELTQAEAETIDLLAGLPESFTTRRKHLYRRVALWVLQTTPTHWSDEHLEQLKATLAAARA